MSSSYPLIYLIPSVLYLMFYIGALFFLIGKRSRHPQAARLAIIGANILLVSHVGGWLSTFVLVRLVDSGQFMLFNGIIQLFFSLAHLTAIGIILAAVFAGRRSMEADQDGWGATELPAASDNPYVPPTAR